MSVYTELSHQQIEDFLQYYDLTLVSYQPIKNGIENTNYFVTASQQEGNSQIFVLTVFEQLTSLHAQVLSDVLTTLDEQQLPVACPIKAKHSNTDSNTILMLHNKPAQLAHKRAGSHPDIASDQQIIAIAEGLAKLHLGLQKVSSVKHLSELTTRTGEDSPLNWLSSQVGLSSSLSGDDKALLAELSARFFLMTQQQALPTGLIHGDLFRDNLLMEEDKLTALLDLSELHQNAYVMDIAITVNDTCLLADKVSLDTQKYQLFLESYSKVRALQSNEYMVLPVFLAMAGARFWVSRTLTNEAHQNANDALVLVKDPLQMKQIMLNHLRRMDIDFY